MPDKIIFDKKQPGELSTFTPSGSRPLFGGML